MHVHPDRKLEVAVGLVVALSILWTIAVLVPDSSEDRFVNPNQFKLVHNGTHLIVDMRGIQRLGEEAVDETNVIHVSSPHVVGRKHNANQIITPNELSFDQQKEPSVNGLEFPSNKADEAANNTTARAYTSDYTQRKEEPPQTRYSSLSYAWFACFIIYHARNWKRRRVTYEDDFFSKSGLEAQLKYEDFIGADHSRYGSFSTSWSGEDLDKFDV